MGSVAGVGLSELVMAMGLYWNYSTLNIVGLFAFVGAFSLGLGPICWLFCSEIMPVEVRAKGMVIACSMNRLMSFAISDTFLSMVSAFRGLDKSVGGQGDENAGQAGVFFLFFVISFLCLVFVYVMVPETKGKTLEEMGEFFEKLAQKYPGPQTDDDDESGLPRMELAELETARDL